MMMSDSGPPQVDANLVAEVAAILAANPDRVAWYNSLLMCCVLPRRFLWRRVGGAQKSSCSRHEDLTFKLHSNHEGRPAGRPAPSPPGSGSGIRYIPTPNGAGREGYYTPHILIFFKNRSTSSTLEY